MLVNKHIHHLLEDSTRMLSVAAEDAEIQSALAVVGVSEEALAYGRQLVAALEEAMNQKVSGYGAQYRATDTVEAEMADLHVTYVTHVEAARGLFKEDLAAWQRLDLGGERERPRSRRLIQALLFYSALQEEPELRSRLSVFGLTEEAVADHIARIEAVDAARNEQATSKSIAQEATALRDAAADELRGFMHGFKRFVRLATRERPQLRERLGMVT